MFMKLALLVLLVLFNVGGCRTEQPVDDSVDIELPDYRVTEVIIEGGDSFPPYLVGTWVDERQRWQFTFQPDGQISNIVHSMGRVSLEPGKVKKIPMRFGGTSIYEPGQWVVIYNNDNKYLTVQIVLEYMYAEIGDGIVEGSSVDIFSGPVEDKEPIWLVDWISYPEYTAHTEKYPNFSLRDKNDPPKQQSLVFKKTQPNEDSGN